MAASVTHPFATPPKLQSSYSSNDVPTMKNPSGSSLLTNNANNHAQQHLHNHNASIGRIPQGILPTRHSREMSNESNTMNTNREQVQVQQVQQAQQYPSIQSALQANAAPFGPSSTIVTAPHQNITSSSNGVAGINHYNGFYPPNGYAPPHNTNNMGVTNGLNGVTGNLGTGNNFGVPMLTAGLQQMNMGQGNGGNIYPQQNFAGYGAAIYNGPAPSQPPRDSQARVIQSRRQMDNEGTFQYFIPSNPSCCFANHRVFQLCLVIKVRLWNISMDRFTSCAKISMGAVTSKRSLKSETPNKCTIFGWRPISTLLNS